MTTEATTEIQVEAARARWRADLLEWTALEHQRIAGADSSPVAQNLIEVAATKRAEATIHHDLAEAMVRHSAVKQERDANPKDESVQRRYAAATRDLVELRQYWRGIDEWLGTRQPVMALDHFPEPTDDEVLASHGGTN